MNTDLNIISDDLAIKIYDEFFNLDPNKRNEYIEDLIKIQVNCMNEILKE